MYDLYLAHHGILGQRWGVRRYQNKDGSLTAAGKKHYDKQEKQNARHKMSEARKRAVAEKAKQTFEENRQKALRTGNATEVLKYKNYLTQKELQDALTRINTERQLMDVSAKELAAGKNKVGKALDAMLDTADKWRARGEKFAGVWNFIAKVHNSFSEEEDAWQKIGESSVKKAIKDNKDKAAKEASDKTKTLALEKALTTDKITFNEYVMIKKQKDSLSEAGVNALIKKFDEEKKKENK